jgi:hypothetical protein
MRSLFTCAKSHTPLELYRLFNDMNIFATIVDGEYKGLWHRVPNSLTELLKETLGYKPVDVAMHYKFCYIFKELNRSKEWGK